MPHCVTSWKKKEYNWALSYSLIGVPELLLETYTILQSYHISSCMSQAPDLKYLENSNKVSQYTSGSSKT